MPDAEKFTFMEKVALRAAAEHSGGWGLYNPKTTAKLAARGFFVKDRHPGYGVQWRITAAGRAAFEAAQRGR